MRNHAAFSALRLARIFPRAHLESYPFYREVDPDGDFDTEYLGGQWDEELIDGVQFFFPACDGNQLGVVEVWGSAWVVPAAVRDKPGSPSECLVPAWAANADRVLQALELAVRMGSDEAAVRALAAGRVLRSEFPDEWYELVPGPEKGTFCSLCFACRAPDLYHVQAVVHAAGGLLKLTVFQPDVVRANDAEGAYDRCTEGLYDEGPEDG